MAIAELWGRLVGQNGATRVLVGIVVIILVRRIAMYLKLRQFKGPFGTGFSSFSHMKAFYGPELHLWYESASAKYGTLARVGPNAIITSSPDIWTHVNVKPGYKRTDWYYHAARIEHRRDNVFSMTDNEKHDARRKQMAPGYSGRENLDLEPAIDKHVQAFIGLIRSKYLSTADRIVQMDLSTKVQFFTLDVISAVGLGKSFGMLEADRDVDDYIKSSEEGLRIGAVSLAFGISWVPQTPWLGRFVAPSPRDKTGFGRMMKTCFRYVDERVANPTDARSDMLASFIRHGLSGDELRSEALEQLIAGSDTTAGAIRGILLQLFTHAHAYKKLQREIDEAVAQGTAPQSGAVISMAQARQLPYLQAVIREGMRVWPSVVNPFFRDVPPEGDTVTVDGKPVFLPGGTAVGYSAYAIHHSKGVYGEDAKAFRPERWLCEKDPDRLSEMTSINNLIFGHGRFQCLGKPVAQIELSKVIFELMRHFDWGISNPSRPWRTHNVLGLFCISDLWVQVMER